MDAESITMMLNAWILAFRKLFEDIGLDRVIRKRLRKALVFKYDSYVLCRAGTEEPIAVMFPHMGRIYYAPTLSMFEKAGPHGRHFGE